MNNNNFSISSRNKYWKDFIFHLDDLMLDNITLKLAITKFFEIVMSNLSDERQVGFIFRVKFTDGSIKSYSYLQKFNNSAFNDVLKALEGF